MDNVISWGFLLGFLGNLICFVIIIIKGIKKQQIFSVSLIIVLSIFLSIMSLSIGIKLAIINSLEVKNEKPLEYEVAIKNFNKGNFKSSIENLDKALTKNRHEEYLYKYSVIKLIIFASEEKSFNYLTEVYSKAAEKGKLFYSYEDLLKFKEMYNKIHIQEELKEQQVNDTLQFIITNIDKDKVQYKIPLEYSYKDENIKDLIYFKMAAYPIPTEEDIEQCRNQAYNYNISKINEECIKGKRISYPKLIYTAANCLNNKKHRNTYESCLNKILEIADKKDECRKKAEEDLKKLKST